MSLNDKVAAEITAAMKSKDAARLSALRMLKAAITNKGVEKGRYLEVAETLQVVSSLVNQRRDWIEQFVGDVLANSERATLHQFQTRLH
jgi:hypothetical protein